MEVIDVGILECRYDGRLINADVMVKRVSPYRIASLGKRIEKALRGDRLNLCMMRIKSVERGALYSAFVNSDEEAETIRARLMRLAKLKRLDLIAQILVYEACEDTRTAVARIIEETKRMSMDPKVQKW